MRAVQSVLFASTLIGLLILGPSGASAQDPASPPGEPTQAEVSESALAATPGDAEPWSEPTVQRATFDPQAATRAYLSQLSPQERERSDAYFEGGYWLQLWGFLYALAVAWLLLARRISAGMRDLAERLVRFRPLQTAAYAVQYILLTWVLFFPLSLYRDFVREHQYGLATQTFGEWMRDLVVALGVSLVLLSVLVMILYGVLRRAPRTWWLWGAGVMVLFLAFVVLIAPVYIDPLFNTYTPLEDPEVKESILSLARANGVPADEVYQFDASRQSTRISANVTGFLGTMRIRLNDNLLKRCSPAEIEAVMAHEMGHYLLNHVYELLILFGLVIVIGFVLLKWSADRAIARWGVRWGVRGVADVAGLPLLLALLSIYLFVLTPVTNAIIRSNEVEADIFGLNAAGEPDGFAQVALKLGEYRKLDPGPLEELLLFDHPSGRARIQMAMVWKGEKVGSSKSGGG